MPPGVIRKGKRKTQNPRLNNKRALEKKRT